ncbi:uncharacterized protein [Rutidosis leptorrhynchoides]|uniref:uncharacterized protein n=1 Tax=Rutidosis leptorrhynchoides TaxID=125765 RepID=UPI003A992BF5
MHLELGSVSLCQDSDRKVWSLSHEVNYKNRLPTRLNFSVRGMEIENISCQVCGAFVESLDHLLFDCNLAKELWIKVKIWVDMDVYRDSSSWAAWVSWFDSRQANSDSKIKLYVIVASLLWHNWRFRNSKLFGSNSMKKVFIFYSVRSFSFNWLCNRGRFKIRRVDWLMKPL